MINVNTCLQFPAKFIVLLHGNGFFIVVLQFNFGDKYFTAEEKEKAIAENKALRLP